MTNSLIVEQLYKFMQPQYAAALVGLGVVRIGTLYDFRRTEVHGDHIGDKDEGRFDYRMQFGDSPTVFRPENRPPFLEGLIETPLPVSFQGTAIVRKESTPDLYVFCTTSSPSPLSQYGKVRVRIHNPAKFFEAIDAVVHADFRGVHSCRYKERVRPHERWGADDEHAEIVKPARYAHEREVRALWLPSRAPIRPFVTMIGSLPRYCEIDEP